MTLTSRRKRPLDRRQVEHRDSSLIVIATEGSKTEKQYFECFRGARVQVEMLPSEGGRSAPRWVLNRLDRYRREFQIAAQDALWLVIDRDRWEERDLSEVASECLRKDYHLAVSNPCFEVWLYLHLKELDEAVTYDGSILVQLLREELGSFNKSNIQSGRFSDGIDAAIRRAEALDVPRRPGPGCIVSCNY